MEDADEKLIDEPAKHSDRHISLIMIVTFTVLIIFTLLMYKQFFSPIDTVDKYTFNNFEFTKKSGLWVTEIQVSNTLITIPLHYGPRETSNVEIIGSFDEIFNSDSIYITFDPTTENASIIALAAAELSLNLVQGINRNLIAACTVNETEACYTRPIINCDNTQDPVIVIKKDKTAAVEFDGNCIRIKGEGQDLIKSVDKLLLLWYEII